MNTKRLKSKRCEPEEFYVYVYLDVRKPMGRYTFECPSGRTVTFSHPPYYVGKGKGDRSHRHIDEALRSENGWNAYKNRLTRRILEKGLEPKIVVTKSRSTDCNARALEIDLIAGIGRHCDRTGTLTNLTLGGDGPISSPEDTRRAIEGKARAGYVNMVDYNGVQMTLRQAALASGIFYGTVLQRFRKGWPDPFTAERYTGPLSPRPIKPKKERKPRTDRRLMLEVGGVRKTFKDWSEELGLNIRTMKSRLRAGLPPRDIIKPAQRRNT